MILISVHTLAARAEIYVDDNSIKAFDVAFFTGAYKNSDESSVNAIIETVYKNNFLSPIAKKAIFREFPAVLLKMGRADLAAVALSNRTLQRKLTGV